MNTRQRLLSVDLFRGLTVATMIVVNAAGELVGSHAGVTVPSFLLHAEWAGCTVADLVFPWFVFVMGVSIPLALGRAKEREGLSGSAVRACGRRAVRLVVLGFLLSLVATLPQPEPRVLVLGVLQRIGIAYFLAAVLYLGTGPRTRLAISAALLLAHWLAVAWVPVPGIGAPDPALPGLNFASWLDFALLGRGLVLENAGPYPYDPEGLLPTLLACLPQALIGAQVGEWLGRPGGTGDRTRPLALAGLALAISGWTWSQVLPWVKAVWSSSYVLWTTGLGMLLLAGLHRWIDLRGRGQGAWARFLEPLGVNPLAAYALHQVLLGLAASPPAASLTFWLEGALPAALASLPAILVVLVATWLPVRWLTRRSIVLRA